MFCVAQHMTLVITKAGIHVHISQQTRLNTHYHNLLLLQVITTITIVFSKQKSAQYYHTNITYFQSVDFEHEILLNTFFFYIFLDYCFEASLSFLTVLLKTTKSKDQKYSNSLLIAPSRRIQAHPGWWFIFMLVTRSRGH